MAIVKSLWAKGEAVAVRPQTAGSQHIQNFVYDFGKEKPLAAGDILDFGVLPPYARIAGASIFTEGTFTGLTADVGIMTGEPGKDFLDDGVTARTSNDVIWTAIDLTGFHALEKSSSLLVEAVDYERSVGVKVSAAVAAAAGKRLHMQLFYYQ